MSIALGFALLVALSVVALGAPWGGGGGATQPVGAASTALGVNLDQWANLPGQGWQNGDLNGSNSTYAEGRVVPFRLAIDGLTGGTGFLHTIHINYDFMAGNHEAYDFLATWNATEAPPPGLPLSRTDLCAPGGGGRSSLCDSDVASANPGVCTLVLATDQTGCTSAFGPDTFSPTQSSPLTVDGAITFSGLSAQRYLTIYGGTITNITAPAHTQGKNTAGDITVTFKSAGSSVFFAWGGHLAQSCYWNGCATPNGAGQISGAPWHMRTQNLDGSGSKNQDRSIQPSALAPNTPTPTNTPTNTPTDTPTNTPTDTPTNTPTDTPTNTPTFTPTNTPTDTPTNTPTDTPTNTPTDTPTNTPTDTPTNTPTDTPTNTPTDTPTNTPTDTPTNTPTDTPTNTPTDTPTPTFTPTDTPTDTPTPTFTPTDTPTDTPTATDTATNTPTNTPTATNTPVVGQGCSPGFWKTHQSLWDSFADPIALATLVNPPAPFLNAGTGFDTTTKFNAFFNLTPTQSGFSDNLTMLQALQQGGGDGKALGRQGVSGLLNYAAGLVYNPAGVSGANDLYIQIRNAYITGVFEPLQTNLANANNLTCPLG